MVAKCLYYTFALSSSSSSYHYDIIEVTFITLIFSDLISG